MYQQIRGLRLERWLVLVTILLAILTGAVWAQEHYGRPSGTALSIPVAPGQELHLNIWKQGPMYDPADRDRHDRLIAGGGPMQVAVWYQNTQTVLNQRLALFELPAWPLFVLTFIALFMLFGSWVIRAWQKS